MKTKLVLWGTDAEENKVLIALSLRTLENKVDIWTFSESIVTEEFGKKLMDEWRNGQDLEFPEGNIHIERELTMTDGLLPDDIKVSRGDLIQRAQTEWHFAVLSAMVGSIGDNRLGGWYGYRASKAALNQFMKTLAVECHRSHPQLCITSMHPGTTDSELSRPFQANVKPGKLYTPSQSAGRILRVISAGNSEDSGRFVNWDGKQIPW